METTRTGDDMWQADRQNSQEQRTFGESLASFFGVMFCCMSSYDDEVDETHSSDRKLEISAPTNFRREEMDIPGLTEEQSKMYREKQRRDAERMWSHLQPLRSSPSGTFAERPADNYPTFEAFTQPRSAPKPGEPKRSPLRVDTTHNPISLIGEASPNTGSTIKSRADSVYTAQGQLRANPRIADRVKAHSRKISESWHLNLQRSSNGALTEFHQPPYQAIRDPQDVEMARLVHGMESKTTVNTSAMNSPVGDGKQSEDSFSTRLTESTERERYVSGWQYKI